MKIGIVGSRGISVVNLKKYLPKETTEIVSGGAIGVDSCAKEYALKHNLPIKEFLPEYKIYGRAAPLKRNIKIIDYSDAIFAFWDGKSKGTKFVIDECNKKKKEIHVFIIQNIDK